MKMNVLFVHGAGDGAYEEYRRMVASLQDALGAADEVHSPRMRNEESPEYADWKSQITSELAALMGDVRLVGHSVGGTVLIKNLSEKRERNLSPHCFCLQSHIEAQMSSGNGTRRNCPKTLPQSWRVSRESSCKIAVTTTSYPLLIWRSMLQDSPKQYFGRPMVVGTNSQMIWRIVLRTIGKQKVLQNHN